MAIGTVLATVENSSTSAIEKLRVEFNILVTKVDAICAKLDLDATVTDTNYRALHADAAGAKKVLNSSGA